MSYTVELTYETKSNILDLDNDCYPIVGYGKSRKYPVDTTHAQRTTLFRKWKQSGRPRLQSEELTWPEFAQTVVQGDYDSIVVQWCGMFLCIETDGHCHS